MYKKLNGLLLAMFTVFSMNIYGEQVEISTMEQLVAFANRVNKGDIELDAVLLNDIDLYGNNVNNKYYNKEKTNWIPIGESKDFPYKGHFNGMGHVVKNAKFMTYDDRQVHYATGFFGSIDGGIVENLIIRGASFNSHMNSLGGVCGSLISGEVSNCSFEGVIESRGSKPKNYIGGICGSAKQSIIKNSSSLGQIVLQNAHVVGGICGRIEASSVINSCINSANIGKQNQEDADNIGGISSGADASCYVTNCLNIGKISCVYDICGICLDSAECKGSNNYCKEGTADVVGGPKGSRFVNDTELKDGSLAYLLCKADSAWGQNLKTDMWPVLGGPKVFLLKLSADANGTVSGDNGYCNSPVHVSAVPNEGYFLDKWSTGDTSKSLVLDLKDDALLSASFVKGEYVTIYNGTEYGEQVLWNPSIRFVPEGNQMLFTDIEGIKGENVVFENSCKKLSLKDGYSFYSPSGFKVDSAVYNRELTSWKVFSFVLPFSVKAKDVDGVIYHLENMSGESFYFESVEDETKPNVPYIVSTKGTTGLLLPNGTTNATCEGTNALSIEAGSAQQLGSYEVRKFKTSLDTSFYAIKEGRMTMAKLGATITNNPFRSVFAVPTASQQYKPSYSLMFDGEVGAIEVVVNDEEELVGNVYDLNGRVLLVNVDLNTALQSELPNGVFVINGAKLMKRNGKLTQAGLKQLKKKTDMIISD